MTRIEDLYNCYKQDVYRYLLSLTHDQTLSEDLLSETFLKAIYGISSYRGDSTIKTWLFGIARNVWLQQLRKKRPEVEYDELMGVYVKESMEDAFITRQTLLRIGTLLEERGSREKSVVSLRALGYSYAEIAAQLSISENSARVIEFRTKQWLKRELGREGLL